MKPYVASLQYFLSVFEITGLQNFTHIAGIGFALRQWVHHIQLFDVVFVAGRQRFHHQHSRELRLGAEHKNAMGCTDVTGLKAIGRHQCQFP